MFLKSVEKIFSETERLKEFTAYISIFESREIESVILLFSE